MDRGFPDRSGTKLWLGDMWISLCADPDSVEIISNGEGGWFSKAEFIRCVKEFVSERL